MLMFKCQIWKITILTSLVFQVCLVDVESYNLKCPSQANWKFRARVKCNSTLLYFCLYNNVKRKYVEGCRGPDWDRKGCKRIFARDFSRDKCTHKRFQPFLFLTNGSMSDCIYAKSICSEEGQIVYTDKSTKDDRSCRCDYKRNYSFIKTPRNVCFCIPTEEDCSCYVKSCPENMTLSSDYRCTQSDDLEKPKCIEITKFNKTMIEKTGVVIEQNHFWLSKTAFKLKWRSSSTAAISCLCLICLTSLTILAIIRKTRKLSNENMQKVKVEVTLEAHREIQKIKEELKYKANSPGAEINRIILENKWEACALVLCILCCDGFDTDWLKLNLVPENKKAKLEDIVNEFGISFNSETSMNSLKDAFSSLNGIYLECCMPVYTIINFKIYQQVSVTCGQTFTECFIKHASSTLIRDQFLFESIKDVQSNDDLIILPKDKEKKYFERLLIDLRELNITSTFQNKQLKYFSFVNKLIRFLEGTEEAKIILKNLDNSGRTVVKEDYKNSGWSCTTTPLIESASGGYVEIVHFLIDNVKSNVNQTDGRKRSALYKACEGGNTNVVQLLLEKNADVLLCNMYGESPLYVACKRKHRDIVDILLQNNANVLQCTNSKKSPLYAACAGGCHDIVELLLKKDASVNQCDKNMESPLYVACLGGHKDIVDKLLRKAANFSQCDSAGESPLHVACAGGYTDIVALLLQKDVDVNQCNSLGESPLYLACAQNYKNIVVQLLRKDANVNQCDSAGESPLHIACARGYTDIVEMLLQTSVDFNQCNRFAESPLYVACRGNYKDIVEMLLTKKADVHQCDSEGKSPLYVACEAGYTDIVKLLLKTDVDVNQCDSQDKSPLYVACEGNYKDIVRLLVTKKTKINQCDSAGKSPLYMACGGNYKEIVELLLTKKTKINQCDSEGKSPLYVACGGNFKDIVEMLLAKKADVHQCDNKGKSPLHQACEGGYTHIVKLLLQTNVDINKCDSEGKSSLHVACGGNYKEIVELLLMKKAKVSQCDSDRKSPLYVACQAGYTDIVKLLLQTDVDVNQCNNEVKTSLDFASGENCKDIVEIVLMKKIDVNQFNSMEESPLYVACAGGHTDIVELLLQKDANNSNGNITGASPLYAACASGHADIVKLLLQNNPDVVHCKNKDKSPLHVACDFVLFNDLRECQVEYDRRVKEHIYIVELLISYNADVHICNSKGKTPLDIANDSGCVEIVKLLEDKLK